MHGVDNNMRREFFGPDGDTTPNLDRLLRVTERFDHHGLDVRDRDGVAAPARRYSPGPRRPLRRAALTRPRGKTTVRRLRCQRGRHAEPPRGRTRFVPGIAFRLPLDQQGVRRRAERARARRARDALRLRGPGRCAKESTRAAESTRRCTASSARRRPRRTSSSRSTAATSGCRRSASAAVASPARTTPAPSCTASSPTSHAACSRAAPTGSTATRASRSATTSTRRTSARRPSRSPTRRDRAPSTTSAAGATTPSRFSRPSRGWRS